MLRRKTLLVGGKHAIGVDAVPRVALSREMVDQRRLVYDPHLPTRYEMREVVILFESFTRLGENGMELSPQRAVLDIFDFAPAIMLTLRALPPLLSFPFPPSRLLAPAELCARCLGPLPCHCIPIFG